MLRSCTPALSLLLLAGSAHAQVTFKWNLGNNWYQSNAGGCTNGGVTSNWVRCGVGGIFPLPSDDVVIDPANGPGDTVVLNDPSGVLCNSIVVAPAATFTVDQVGWTLSIADHFTCLGDLNLVSAAISCPTALAMDLHGPTTLGTALRSTNVSLANAAVNSYGPTTWINGNLVLNGSVWYIEAPFEIAGGDLAANGVEVRSHSTVTKTSPGLTEFRMPFHNDGLVHVEQGTLALTNGTHEHSGEFVIDAGARVEMANCVLRPGTEFHGDGVFAPTAGTVTVNDLVPVDHLELSSNPGPALAGTGAIRVDVSMDWRTGGPNGLTEFRLTPGSMAVLDSPAPKTFGQTHLVLEQFSTLWWKDGPVSGGLSSPSTIRIDDGAAFLIDAAATFRDSRGTTINNSGVLRKRGAGLADFQRAALNNDGLVSVGDGATYPASVLRVTNPLGSGGLSNGEWHLYDNATLIFGASSLPYILGPGTLFRCFGPSGNGVVEIAGKVTVNSPVDFQNLRLVQGGFLDGPEDAAITGTMWWKGGDIRGAGVRLDILPGSRLLVTDSPNNLEGRHLANAGLVSWDTTTPLRLPGATVDNHGLWLHNTDALLMDNGFPGSFNNISSQSTRGEFRKLGAGSMIVGTAFLNNADLRIEAGQTRFTGAFTQLGEGRTILSNNAGIIRHGLTFDVGGGTLEGTGTVEATAPQGVVNLTGLVDPGDNGTPAFGTLTTSHAYTQGAGGTLAADLEGVDAPGQDALAVGGPAALDGTLAVAIGDPDEPGVYHKLWTVLTCASRSGTFAAFVADEPPHGSVTVRYRDTGVDVAYCAADVTGEGSLDIFDFLGFQNLFGAADPRADYAEPFGVFDIFDFLEYQNAYAAGCP